MLKHLSKKTSLELLFDTKDLTPQQIRIIRSLNYSLMDLIVSDNEDSFFEKSSDLMKIVADAIKASHFSENLKSTETKIPYVAQAIEFSIDNLSESTNGKTPRLDN